MTVDVAARLRAARGGRLRRAQATIVVALRMMLHDKAKLIGTTLGVVFAVVLAAQQLGVLFGLLQKNTMFVDNAGADLWIVPPGTTQTAPGQRLSTALLDQARATPGVAVAAPLLMIGTSVSKPGGGSGSAAPATGEGYLLGQARAQSFFNGFFDQSAELWNEAGDSLATTHQIVYFKE